jgi:hypothetical protein
MKHPRRPACIGVGGIRDGFGRGLTNGEFSIEKINLLPIFMHEGLFSVGTRQEAQQAGPIAPVVLFVEPSRQYLLLYASGIAKRDVPALVHVQLVKLQVLLKHGGRRDHAATALCSRSSASSE